MPYPTIDAFKSILLSRPLDEIVQEYIFEGTPFVFRNRPLAVNTLHRHLCPRLKVSQENVTIVGSAKIGFSLAPDSFFSRFKDDSDIDVIVVDDVLFDTVWSLMLKWNYPLRERGMRWPRHRRNFLYWGWFDPERIRFRMLSFPAFLKPLREISTTWFDAFRSLALYPDFANRDVNGRLYRTWQHALLYHRDGLRQIVEIISPERMG